MLSVENSDGDLARSPKLIDTCCEFFRIRRRQRCTMSLEQFNCFDGFGERRFVQAAEKCFYRGVSAWVGEELDRPRHESSLTLSYDLDGRHSNFLCSK